MAMLDVRTCLGGQRTVSSENALNKSRGYREVVNTLHRLLVRLDNLPHGKLFNMQLLLAVV